MSAEESNWVYRLLVPEKSQDEGICDFTRDDFIGFIAYALYKHRKVRWIEKYKEKNGLSIEDRVPKEEKERWQAQEVEHVEDYLELAKKHFADIMARYGAEELERYKREYEREEDSSNAIAMKEFKEDFIKEKIEDAVKLAAIENRPNSFWDKHGVHITHSIVGGVGFALLSIVLLLFWIGFDFFSVLKSLPDIIEKILKALQ